MPRNSPPSSGPNALYSSHSAATQKQRDDEEQALRRRA